MNTPGYPNSRANATATLQACRSFARGMMFNGHATGTNAPTWGVVE